MSDRDDFFLLEDMLESALKIKRYCNNLDYIAFVDDEKTIDAVIRNFEIIGEASNRVNQEFKENHSFIEWNKLKGFRNRLIHEYFGVDNEIVWEIIRGDLDSLIFSLTQILAK